ncbi:MAG: hypothetical protein R3F20_09940 [Planctomycetota bacterium]
MLSRSSLLSLLALALASVTVFGQSYPTWERSLDGALERAKKEGKPSSSRCTRAPRSPASAC